MVVRGGGLLRGIHVKIARYIASPRFRRSATSQLEAFTTLPVVNACDFQKATGEVKEGNFARLWKPKHAA